MDKETKRRSLPSVVGFIMNVLFWWLSRKTACCLFSKDH
jgi:hypothetical protein